MARSINFRSFNNDGDKVHFSSVKFRNELNRVKNERSSSGKKCTLEALCEEIAEGVSVSIESVKNWRKGSNGVGDLLTIKNIAKILNTDYTALVESDLNEEESIAQSFQPVGLSEKELVIQIYELGIDFLYWFAGVDGDSYAWRTLEKPFNEMDKYIFNMYHFLDRIAPHISNDTFMILRQTITEIYKLTNDYGSAFNIPEEWKRQNPILGIDDYETLWEIGAFKQTNEIVYELDEPDSIFHMYLEDVPEDVKNAQTARIEAGKNDTSNKDRPYTQILESERSWLCYDSYKIVVRELSYTLYLVMKNRFPNYF